MALPVSVVIVSRDRPDMLRRCLMGVAQLRYPNFEIVVASDLKGFEAVAGLQLDGIVKTVLFEEPNISEARNRACDVAAGEVIAFIDDDAVPEPTWLHHLVAPFTREDVGAAGGFVRGRNGVSWQWKARRVTETGETRPIEVDETQITILSAPDQGAVKTEGTNMAVRRSALVEIGGFDPAYHFFLDETDVNMRLARAGWATAIVPLAQVHHGFAPSARRRRDRAPKDLFDIGASWAVFLGKHVPEEQRDGIWQRVVDGERRRALGWLQRGGLDAYDVHFLMRRLKAGFAEGSWRVPGTGEIAGTPQRRFAKVVSDIKSPCLLSGRPWDVRNVMAQAQEKRALGHIVTVFLFSPSALFHRHFFNARGIWVQKGGIWGKSDRTQPLFLWQSFATRVRKERARLGQARGFDPE